MANISDERYLRLIQASAELSLVYVGYLISNEY